MSQAWANRQRRTNRLARASLHYLLSNKKLDYKTAHALCELTWITNSYQDKDAAYIKSVKLPALRSIYGDLIGEDLSIAAKSIDVTDVIKSSDVLGHTGFTNFYKAYRKSSSVWMQNNWRTIKQIIVSANNLKSDQEARLLAKKIDGLPHIPTPSGKRYMAPEYLITPLVFSLDPRLRFPIINGSGYIKELIRALNVTGQSLADKHDALVSLIGKSGISDAADVDQIRGALSRFTSKGKDTPGLLKKIKKDKALGLKDEGDYQQLRKNLTAKARRIHNELTNKLIDFLEEYTILEGNSPSCRYDALVKDYDEDGDCLIEVKSSVEMADVRMAVGQLFDYHRQLDNRDNISKAVLLPEEPGKDVKDLIRYADMGLLYFNEDELVDEWF